MCHDLRYRSKQVVAIAPNDSIEPVDSDFLWNAGRSHRDAGLHPRTAGLLSGKPAGVYGMPASLPRMRTSIPRMRAAALPMRLSLSTARRAPPAGGLSSSRCGRLPSEYGSAALGCGAPDGNPGSLGPEPQHRPTGETFSVAGERVISSLGHLSVGNANGYQLYRSIIIAIVHHVFTVPDIDRPDAEGGTWNWKAAFRLSCQSPRNSMEGLVGLPDVALNGLELGIEPSTDDDPARATHLAREPTCGRIRFRFLLAGGVHPKRPWSREWFHGAPQVAIP